MIIPPFKNKFQLREGIIRNDKEKVFIMVSCYPINSLNLCIEVNIFLNENVKWLLSSKNLGTCISCVSGDMEASKVLSVM